MMKNYFKKILHFDTKFAFKPIKSIIAFFVIMSLLIGWKYYLISEKTDLSENDENYGLNELEKQLNQIEIEKKLCVVVVGDGIPSKKPNKGNRPYPKENAQGFDVYEGVMAALSRGVIKDTSLIEFLFIDDADIPDCAKRIGQILSKSKIVLCVIGHASSSATLAALPYYKMANIPVIIPVATNPFLIKGYEEISFRMPTNDTYQAIFIADFIDNNIKPKNICIVWDETPNAKQYSSFLMEKLVAEFGAKVQRKLSINYLSENVQTNNISSIASTIPVTRPDLIIYCGYGSLAKEFFTVLKMEYSKDSLLLNNPPTVVLTDGCSIPDIIMIEKELGFKGYLAFPSELGKDADCFKEIVNNFEFNNSFSYELFGYDAINLLGSLLNNKTYKTDLNRNYVVEELQKGDFRVSSCFQYYFKDGENKFKSYCIYSLDSMKLIKKSEGNNINSTN